MDSPTDLLHLSIGYSLAIGCFTPCVLHLMCSSGESWGERELISIFLIRRTRRVVEHSLADVKLKVYIEKRELRYTAVRGDVLECLRDMGDSA